MTRRLPRALLAAIAVAAAASLAACGGGGGDGGAAPTTTTTSAPPTSTTAADPVELGRAAALELDQGQCWTAPPEPEPGAPTSTTAGAGEVVLDEVVVVDCGAGHDARAYATTCLGADGAGRLGPAACPAPAEVPWPGDRELRRAAVRFCLERFAAEVGEPYATSERTTVELVPSQEEWAAGHRRVVCGIEP